jgi:hypothetical protein
MQNPLRNTVEQMSGTARHPEGCLFCRRLDGGFTSQEHVFSEALGNHEFVLPPGVVCDRCNNGPLSRADQALVDFPPVTLLRAERGLPTRAGKAVVSKWGNATIAFSGPGELEIYGAGRKLMKDMPPPGRMLPGQSGKMELKSGGPITAKRIRLAVRSVWKSALEFVYIDHGPAGGFDPTFDTSRTAIIEPADAEGWAVVPKNAKMHGEVHLSYDLRVIGGRRAVPVLMDIFGFQIYTDLLRRDIPEADIKPPWEANVWKF